jgi:hypothetical protein
MSSTLCVALFKMALHAKEKNMDTAVVIYQRSGQFGPNRVHEVHVGPHKFLVNIVGSGAISLRASVTREGELRFPSERADWTVELASTGGGKVTETLGGTHLSQGFEASTARHRGFAMARVIFYELWGHYFDPTAAQVDTAEAVSKEFRRRGVIPTPPAPEGPED